MKITNGIIVFGCACIGMLVYWWQSTPDQLAPGRARESRVEQAALPVKRSDREAIADVPVRTPAQNVVGFLVQDEQGSLLPGCVLCEVTSDVRAVSQRDVVGEAGVDGVIPYVWKTPRPGHGLWLSMPGFLPQSWVGQNPAVMQKGMSLRARFATRAGDPVAGCRVWVSQTAFAGDVSAIDWSNQGKLCPGPGPHALYGATSNARGEAVLDGVPLGMLAYGVWHPTMVVAKRLPPNETGVVTVPGAEIGCIMEAPIGVRIEFRGETLLSFGFVNPVGTWLEARRSPLPVEEDASQQDSWLAFKGWPLVADGAGDILHVFALLSRSGPCRLDMKLVPVGGEGYRVEHDASDCSMDTGSVRAEVLDSNARSIGAMVAIAQLEGTDIRNVPSTDLSTLSARNLAWGVKLQAGGAGIRLPVGKYRAVVQAPLLGVVMQSIALEVKGGENVARFHVPHRVSEVRCCYPNNVTRWSLQIRGSATGGQSDNRTFTYGSGECPTLWLPEGHYELCASAFGYAPASKELSIKGQPDTVEFLPDLLTR